MQPTELPVDPSTDSGPRSIDSALSKRCLARNLVASASIPPRRSFLACLGRMLEKQPFFVAKELRRGSIAVCRATNRIAGSWSCRRPAGTVFIGVDRWFYASHCRGAGFRSLLVRVHLRYDQQVCSSESVVSCADGADRTEPLVGQATSRVQPMQLPRKQFSDLSRLRGSIETLPCSTAASQSSATFHLGSATADLDDQT